MIEYHHIIQMLALLVGLILYRRNWHTHFKALLALVIISVLVELTGAYITTFLHRENAWLYNIYLLIMSALVYYIFRNEMVAQLTNQIAKWIGIIYTVAVIIFFFLQPDINKLNSYVFSSTFIFFSVLSSTYFLELMNINGRMKDLYKQPGFWFVSAIFFFSVLYICRFTFFNQINRTENYMDILDYFVIVVNTILYGGFIIAFICMYRTKTLLSS